MDLRARLDSFCRETAKSCLRPAQDEATVLRSRRSELVLRLASVEASLGSLEQTVAAYAAPFSAQMTVHQAWARHPGVAAIFARHHLPDCPGCPVGTDERLEEAAFGYGIDLVAWLAELNALLEEGPLEEASR